MKKNYFDTLRKMEEYDSLMFQLQLNHICSYAIYDGVIPSNHFDKLRELKTLSMNPNTPEQIFKMLHIVYELNETSQEEEELYMDNDDKELIGKDESFSYDSNFKRSCCKRSMSSCLRLLVTPDINISSDTIQKCFKYSCKKGNLLIAQLIYENRTEHINTEVLDETYKNACDRVKDWLRSLV